jgi:pantetheine-phosphate adenylyltransferase
MFDRIVIAIGVNQDKRGYFSTEQKIEIIRQVVAGLKGVEIINYDGLTVDICREMGIRHIVRGVRNMLDFEAERSIADANRRLAPEIETLIIPTAQEFAHISSSAVRDLLKHHGDTSLFMPEGVVLPEPEAA